MEFGSDDVDVALQLNIIIKVLAYYKFST